MLQTEWSCYPNKCREILRVTSTSSNLQSGSSRSNVASTSKQETSSDEKSNANITKCGINTNSIRGSKDKIDDLVKFLAVPESKPIQQNMSSKIHLIEELKANSLLLLASVAINNPPITPPASAAATQNYQVTPATSSISQVGTSMNNIASTSEQGTSSDEELTKCGYDTSNRRTQHTKFPSNMESKRIQQEVSLSIQNQAMAPTTHFSPVTAGASIIQNSSANNDRDVMNKMKSVLEHRIELLNLSIGDASAITGIILLLVILHNYPIMTGAIAIVTWIAYRQGMS
jgi:hypothetical protein